MSKEDKIKWNRKFSTQSELLKPREASHKLKNFIGKASGKRALDIACGAGRNTLFLAENGFTVDALDISEVALEAVSNLLKEKSLSQYVRMQLTDLDLFTPDADMYDLVVMTNFLDRELIQRVKAGLKKDGLFIIETYMDDPSNEKKSSDPSYLLSKKELLTFFSSDFEILFYDEFDNEPYEMFFMRKQAVVVKKK